MPISCLFEQLCQPVIRQTIAHPIKIEYAGPAWQLRTRTGDPFAVSPLSIAKRRCANAKASWMSLGRKPVPIVVYLGALRYVACYIKEMQDQMHVHLLFAQV